MGKRNENSDLKKIKLETGTVYQTEKGATTISATKSEATANVSV